MPLYGDIAIILIVSQLPTTIAAIAAASTPSSYLHHLLEPRSPGFRAYEFYEGVFLRALVGSTKKLLQAMAKMPGISGTCGRCRQVRCSAATPASPRNTSSEAILGSG